VETFRLQRHGKLALVFEGELIATASSDDGEKQRWQVFNLYRTTSRSKRYVLERLGESSLEGEVVMRNVTELPNAHQVRKALERKRDSGERYLTIVAIDLLDEAAQRDDSFLEEAAERL
jgi:hypothetical protein